MLPSCMGDYKLGLDVGGVITDRANDNTTNSMIGRNYLKATAVPDSFRLIGLLNERAFQNQVYLVSKCQEEMERKIREWLKHHNFHEETGVPEDHLKFCRDLSDKLPICTELGITHFVDDRLEALSYLVGQVRKLYLFNPKEKEMAKWRNILKHVKTTDNWPELSQLLRK